MSSSSRVIANVLESFGGILWKTLTLTSGLVAIGLGLLYTRQESLLYFPEVGGMARSNKRNPKGYQSPAEHRIPFEEHMIPCNFHHSIVMTASSSSSSFEGGGQAYSTVPATGYIHSWLLLQGGEEGNKQSASKYPTLVFFHGNAGNIGHRIPNAKNYYNHLGVNVLLVEYRGYGDSSIDTDRPTERGMKNDAIAALYYLRSLSYIDPNKIFIFGQSLGGANALYLAQYAESNQLPVAGVILENTFLSIPKMVDVLMPYLKYVKAVVLKMSWDNEDILVRGGLRKTPILFLAGDKDELVPHHHMLQLYQTSIRNEKRKASLTELYIVKGGGHNDTWMKGGRHYYERMNSFISTALIHRTNDDGDDYDDDRRNTPFNSTNRKVEGSGLQRDSVSNMDSSIEVDMGGINPESDKKVSKIFARENDDKKKVN